VLREEFDDWAVLFNPDTGHGFGLNPIGVQLWKLLDGKHSVDEMFNFLRRDALNVPEEASERLVTFIDELIRHGLAGYAGERGKDCSVVPSLRPICERVPETMKLTYEPPRLVDFKGAEAAKGVNCQPTGSYNSGSCGYGACAEIMCLSGASAGSRCCTGTSPAWTSDCWAGDCPTRCANCTTGGGLCQFGYTAGGGTQCESGSAAHPCQTGDSPI
jgi:SynChlorMet cassette protein ScmD